MSTALILVVLTLASYMNASQTFSDGVSQRTLGRILLAAGGAAALGGLVLTLTTSRSEKGSALESIGPWLETRGGQLACGAIFSSAWW